MLRLVIILFVALGLYSCAHKTKKNEPIALKNTEQQQADYAQVITKTREKLGDLVKEAQSLGPKSVNYLASNLFVKASHASLVGDYESSVILFEHVHKLVPDDTFIALKYSVDLIRVGKIAESKDILVKYYNQKDPYFEKVAMLLAGIHTSYKDLGEAQKVYKKIVNLNAKNTEACVFLAKAYGDEQKWKKADYWLNRCSKVSADQGVFDYYKGRMQLQRNNVSLATQFFKKSLKKEPTYYRSALGLGLIYEDKGQLKEAKNLYQNFLKKWASNRVILTRLVQVLFAMESYDEVTDYAKALLSIDPSNLNLKVKLGIIYTDKKDYKNALKIFNSVLEEVPGSDKVLYYLGAIYQEVKNYEKSIEVFMQIQEESALFLDSSIQITQMLSAMAIQDKDKEDELVEFVDSRTKSPQLQVELNVILGQYYEMANNLSSSINSLEKVAHLSEFTNPQKYYLAMLQDKAKNYDRSVELLTAIVKAEPENAHAWNFIGYSYLERELYKEAFPHIQKAVSISPKDGYIRDSMGWYYYKIGEHEKALEELSLAFKLQNDDSVIAQHLGEVYLSMKKFQQAKKYFSKALELGGKPDERTAIETKIQKIDEYLGKRLPASGSASSQ